MIMSGTHALTLALFGILRPGDTFLSIAGDLYDTLYDVIYGKNIGSLADFNISFDKIDLKNGTFDEENIIKTIEKTRPKWCLSSVRADIPGATRFQSTQFPT